MNRQEVIAFAVICVEFCLWVADKQGLPSEAVLIEQISMAYDRCLQVARMQSN